MVFSLTPALSAMDLSWSSALLFIVSLVLMIGKGNASHKDNQYLLLTILGITIFGAIFATQTSESCR